MLEKRPLPILIPSLQSRVQKENDQGTHRDY
jgi:hypothetical protein